MKHLTIPRSLNFWLWRSVLIQTAKQRQPSRKRESFIAWQLNSPADPRLQPRYGGAPATLGGREHRRRNYQAPVIVALSMLTLALGIRLPEEVARGTACRLRCQPRQLSGR